MLLVYTVNLMQVSKDWLNTYYVQVNLVDTIDTKKNK